MKKLIILCALALCVSSCYTVNYNVGKGAVRGIETKAKNHFIIYGLAPVGKQETPEDLAGDAEDYTVTITHTFIDSLMRMFTFGIYTPTTTFVTK